MTRHPITREQRGLGHLTLVTPTTTATRPPARPCPDVSHCLFWRRLSSGPWTCEHCHPSDPIDAADAIELAHLGARS